MEIQQPTRSGLHTGEAGVASIAWGESSNPRYSRPLFKPMERAAEILVRPLAWALSLFIRYLGFEDSPQARLEPPPSEVVKTKAEGCDVFVQTKTLPGKQEVTTLLRRGFNDFPLCPRRPPWFKCLWLKRQNPYFGVPAIHVLLTAIFIMVFAISIRADGGVVLWQRKTPSYTVTVFTVNTPIQTGMADISVMIEGTGGTGPIMDARVFFELENHAGMILRSEATHRQSANKLLYCSLIDLPEPGHWPMKIIIDRNGDKTEVPGHLMVASQQSTLFSNGKLIAFPPIIAILFVVNQWLRRNRRS